jgi:hypothetical protein
MVSLAGETSTLSGWARKTLEAGILGDLPVLFGKFRSSDLNCRFGEAARRTS